MKKKRYKLKSIKSKLIVSMVCLCVIPLIILGIISYMQSTKIIERKMEDSSVGLLNAINQGIDKYFDGAKVQLNTAGDQMNFLSDQNNNIESEISYLRNLKKNNSDIVNAFYGTESKSYIVIPEVKAEEQFNPQNTEWYRQAVLQNGNIVISQPYLDKSTNKMVVTLSKTVCKDDKILGVIGFDLSIDKLTQMVNSTQVGTGGFINAFDQDGTVIIDNVKENIGTDIIKRQSFWSEVGYKSNGFIKYEYNGEKKIGAFATNDSTGWKFMENISESNLTNDLNVTKNTIIAGTIIVSIIGVIVSLIISIRITNNINKLSKVFSKASSGDLTVTSDIKSDDELGILSKDFNNMISNISALIKSVRESSEIIQKTCTGIAAVSEETTASVSEVAKAMEEIANGTSKQANLAIHGTNKMTILSDNIEVISTSIEDAKDISISTKRLSRAGIDTIDDLTEKSTSTKNASNNINNLVLNIHDSMKKITDISEKIAGITEQTNLLALNASIEAARAGESGKGFSVVADEIRGLAEKSKDSTQEIKRIISVIQKQSIEAVDSIEVNKNVLKSQEEAITLTKNIFNKIIFGGDDLFEKINIISTSKNSVNQSKDEVESSTNEISHVSQDIASGAQQVSAEAEQVKATMEQLSNHAEELTFLSQNLREGIFKFNLEY